MATATSSDGLQAARDRLRGDWDENGTTTIHLPQDVAERLLAERGWNPAGLGHGGCGWVAPDGTHFWHTDEALTFALVAENA